MNKNRKYLYDLEYEKFILACKEDNYGNKIFPDSELSVFTIGGMLASGHSKEQVLKEYTELYMDDVKYAKTFYYKELNRLENLIKTTTAIEKLRKQTEGK